MGVSAKSVNFMSIIAAICIAVYIMAVAFGAAQIIESITERRNIAEQEFYDIADRATSSSVFLGFMSEPYRETIKDSLFMSETLLAVIITGGNNEYAFERYQGSGIVWSGDSPRFKTGAGYPKDPFTLFLRIDGQRNATIKAIYSFIDYDVFVRTFKNTLLAVLIALAIAFITLLVEMTMKKKAVNVINNYQADVNPPESIVLDESVNSDFSEPVESGENDESTENDEPEESAGFDESAENDESGESAEFDESEFDESEIPDISFSDEEENTETPLPDSGSAQDPKDPEDHQDPQGLFTPRGNIGWESYINDRLTSELHRCSSFEQDLVFIVMEFGDDAGCDDTLFRQFSDEAVNFFITRDLIFEKGKNGISVIFPNADLELGMAKSYEFRSIIMNKLPESFEGRTTLCIGLSSRSGRLVESDRLIFESTTALEKALNDPDAPVVAFKSDLDKYREFIKKRS